MNRAIDVTTWLGGDCCNPMACLSNPSTMTIRTKHVVISKMAGAMLSTVSRSMISRADVNPSRLVHA
jgi:hypothetical protein